MTVRTHGGKVAAGEEQGMSGITSAPGAQAAPPRLQQELAETLQRLRLGGPFYVLLWLLAGTASGLWERARWPFLLVALVFLLLNLLRFQVRGLPDGASESAVRRRLDWIWTLLLANSALWSVAVAWLLLTTPSESARTVAAISSYAFATAFAHNFPMRLREAFIALGLLYLPTLGALVANGSRLELIAVSCLYLLYVSLALRRSHGEYRQRLDLEDELRRQRDLFEQQSRRDGLTGLANRRRFSATLGDWCARARTDGDALVLLLLDLDHFKSINDRHGHAAGDACLCVFSARLQAAFPDTGRELVARLGGEEFGVLVRGGLDETARRADEFRAALAAQPLALPDNALHCSVSIGVAAFDPRRDGEGEALYHAADTALYRAKAAGRDAVAVADPG
ncbi:GGDEF domain-containing protein [Thermomonas sp.]|uniref:GGDEF domain-containing protein n=1 Tax=Thermomonas sp. TaxID=1971895 RepID=UPI0039196AB3